MRRFKKRLPTPFRTVEKNHAITVRREIACLRRPNRQWFLVRISTRTSTLKPPRNFPGVRQSAHKTTNFRPNPAGGKVISDNYCVILRCSCLNALTPRFHNNCNNNSNNNFPCNVLPANRKFKRRES